MTAEMAPPNTCQHLVALLQSYPHLWLYLETRRGDLVIQPPLEWTILDWTDERHSDGHVQKLQVSVRIMITIQMDHTPTMKMAILPGRRMQ